MSRQVQASGILGCILVAPFILLQIFFALAIPCAVLSVLVAGVYFLCTGEFILQ